MKFYVIWRRPDNTLYFRYVRGTYKRYYIGYVNQYEHEVVLLIKPNVSKVSIKDRIKYSLVRYIKKL